MDQMKDRTILYYQNKAISLIPDSSLTESINNEEWYQALKPHINNLLWQYYANRVVFIDSRFRCDDTDDVIIENIKRSFAINLTTRAYTYKSLYNTTVIPYNPIWNVDGVEGHIREYNKNGTRQDKHTGNDKLTRDMKKIYEDYNINTTDTMKNDVTTTSTFKNTYDSGNTDYPTERVVSAHTGELNPPERTIDTTHSGDIYDKGSDTTTFNNTHDYTDQDHYNELAMDIRQGNIGVTSTQNLLNQERELVEFDFFKRVVHDCVNTCTYAVE